MKKTKGLGFTLIELLVVIAIIGLLTVAVMVAVRTSQSRARDAKRMADLKQVQTAIALYLMENPYAPTCPGSNNVNRCLTFTSTNGNLFTDLTIKAKQMPQIPVDPKSGTAGYGYIYIRGYKKFGPAPTNCYSSTGNYRDYILATRMEDKTKNNLNGLVCSWSGVPINYIIDSQ